jgi:hypothetical protein
VTHDEHFGVRLRGKVGRDGAHVLRHLLRGPHVVAGRFYTLDTALDTALDTLLRSSLHLVIDGLAERA